MLPEFPWSTPDLPRVTQRIWYFFRALPGAALCAGICASLSPSPAEANFQVCNQTLDVINVAIGAYDVDEWETRGWWIVGPNQCANVIEEELTSRYIYVYARDVFNKSMLDGTTSMCIKPEEFRLRGRVDCLLKGTLSADFFEVDTRRSERWTFYLQAPLD